MNADQLRDLGFQLESRALGGEAGGAWFAIDANGERVLLNWFADEGVADRYEWPFCGVEPAAEALRFRSQGHSGLQVDSRTAEFGGLPPATAGWRRNV